VLFVYYFQDFFFVIFLLQNFFNPVTYIRKLRRLSFIRIRICICKSKITKNNSYHICNNKHPEKAKQENRNEYFPNSFIGYQCPDHSSKRTCKGCSCCHSCCCSSSCYCRCCCICSLSSMCNNFCAFIQRGRIFIFFCHFHPPI